MTLSVALLIASEFLPVSLLTPIAADLDATEGTAGQAISISGLFAVASSLCVATVAGRIDRRHVLVALAALMLASLVLIAGAPSFGLLMAARALLGVAVGGFWALATATLMRLVPRDAVRKALGFMYMGNAVATALAAPIGSYLGGAIGWRGVFWVLVPLALANLAWLWASLPSLPAHQALPMRRLLGLLKRRNVALAMLGVMLSFGGAFATFTYLRPFLEIRTQATLPQLSLLLLALGAAGFVGTSAATSLVRRHLPRMLRVVPLALAAVTLAMLAGRQSLWPMALLMAAWGALNSAMPVSWSNWLAVGVPDEPEGGGGLMVAAIQLAIMLGASFGGLLLDHLSITATFTGGAFLLLLAAGLPSAPRDPASPAVDHRARRAAGVH